MRVKTKSFGQQPTSVSESDIICASDTAVDSVPRIFFQISFANSNRMNTTLIPKPITSTTNFIPLLARCTRFKAKGFWGMACKGKVLVLTLIGSSRQLKTTGRLVEDFDVETRTTF